MKKFLMGVMLAGPISLPAHALKSSSVSFVATGNPGFLAIDGKGAKLEKLEISEKDGWVKGKAVAVLVGLTTDMDLRDEHMHEKYLETKKHPRASLTFEGKNGIFKGLLTLKKTTKPVAGNYLIHGKKITARFKINLSDFPIGVPSWLGVTVAEEVAIVVKAEQ